MLTYKRKLILTQAQQSRIDGWIGTCRFVYNMGLEIQVEAYKNHQKKLHKFDLIKQLPTIKDVEWIADVPSQTLQAAIERLDNTYEAFFRTVKNGGGFPKFANKQRYKSILFKTGAVEGNFIILPKIGRLKIFKDSEILGTFKNATIKKEPTGYFVCITTDSVKSIQSQNESQILGLDMGITHFAVDSNGGFISNHRHFKQYERKLRIENRSLARKMKGSNSWKRQAKKLALLHHKIGNVRRDFLHKASTQIAKANHTVILEDLNVAGMVKGNLSKSISDAGWGTFRRMLEYKTEVVTINPRYTSQTCNDCGIKDSKSRLSQSRFVCTACGVESNADENAAKNILGLGKAVIRERKAIA